ncbi:MAG: hypothetical protein HYY20_00560 [Candidatus Tectomicrobia bacterium]|uniref:Uncharacterized protein n=1 Tax=Tectimicrobiota bacterium TaxID=2528274 RepID=A0A932FU94_UNCTE|nr:hypothetical protein [Candidatus Tectomicrobia bacterium]
MAKLNPFAQKIDFGGKGKVRPTHKHNGAQSALGEGEITITPPENP